MMHSKSEWISKRSDVKEIYNSQIHFLLLALQGHLPQYKVLVTRLATEESYFDFGQGKETILICMACRPAMRVTQTPVQWVLELPSSGIKRPWRETDRSCSRNAESYSSAPPNVLIMWCLIKLTHSYTFLSKLNRSCRNTQHPIYNIRYQRSMIKYQTLNLYVY
jgi:hypothetical protein